MIYRRMHIVPHHDCVGDGGADEPFYPLLCTPATQHMPVKMVDYAR